MVIVRTVAFKLSTNGLCERFTVTLIRYLKAVGQPDPWNWDKHLPMAMLAYRTRLHIATVMTPKFLLYAREIKLACDLIYGHPPPQHRMES